jgi:predicted enzyme related to lactoylglutathione lyase
MSTTWLCLCLDVNGPGLGEFWAGALGASLHPGRSEDDPGSIHGPEGLLIELNPVPEEKTVKYRVHLDVHAGSLEELTGAGARILHPQSETGFGWTVLQDPEGGEFCAFLRDEPPAYRLYEVGVDSRDPQAIAIWWGERFGVTPSHDGEDPSWGLENIPGSQFESLVFAPVPEPKTVKNRIHWDVRGDVAELERAGARVLWEMPRWVTMADPEGNEFCVFPPAD